MIYTDYIHIISDSSLQELHNFCKEIGIKRCWFENHRKPHYDIPKYKLEEVKKSLAIYKTSKELIGIINAK